MTEKDAQEIAEDLLGQGEESIGQVAVYKLDADKLSQHSYKAIADALNNFFGPIIIDMSDEGKSEKMFLDGALGPFISRDDKKVDLFE